MKNNVIKYLLENDKIRLDNYNIPIENDTNLNELELKLRKEIGYLMGRIWCLKGRCIEADFEDFIVKRIRKIIDIAFLPIGDIKLEEGQIFRWGYLNGCMTHFFPNLDISMKEAISMHFQDICRDVWTSPDPEHCYFSNEEYKAINKPRKIKMKKHRRK